MPTTPPATPPSATPELRRHLLQLVLGVVALDALAVGLYHWLGVDGWATKGQRGFTAGWVALTLVVVLPLLQRIRVARVRARRARAGLR